jgi:hypothetical protein
MSCLTNKIYAIVSRRRPSGLPEVTLRENVRSMRSLRRRRRRR